MLIAMLNSYLDLPWYSKILIRPPLSHRSPLLLRLRDRFPGLDLAPEHDVAETVAESVTFWFQETKGVAEFFWQNEFQGRFRKTGGYVLVLV